MIAHYIICINLLVCIEYNLAEMLRRHSEEWGISSQVIAVVNDNATNLVSAVNRY